MPKNVTVVGKLYSFVEWDNGNSNPARSMYLTDSAAVTAYYVAQTQTQTSTITGKITDNQGNPVTSAKVTVLETGEYTFTLPEPAGEYKFEGLPPNNYTIKVAASGYVSAQTSVAAEPDETITQNFSLTPENTVPAPPEQPAQVELWQLVAAALSAVGAIALFLLWRSRKGFLREIKETDYRNTLEIVRLESRLKELDSLLQRGFMSKEKYEILRKETEDELARIQKTKS